MDSNDYKLVGVIAFVFFRPLYPDFVYPVFEKNNEFYFQDCNSNISTCDVNSMKIDSFKLANINFDKIKFINEDDIQLIGKDEYKQGDDCVLALQLDKDKYIVGDIMKMGEFLSTYDPEPTILKNNLKGINNEEHLKQLNRDIKRYTDYYSRCLSNGKKYVKKP